MSTLIGTHQLPVIRRSANYQPCIWTDDFVQSLATDYTVMYVSFLNLSSVSLVILIKLLLMLNRENVSMDE